MTFKCTCNNFLCHMWAPFNSDFGSSMISTTTPGLPCSGQWESIRSINSGGFFCLFFGAPTLVRHFLGLWRDSEERNRVISDQARLLVGSGCIGGVWWAGLLFASTVPSPGLELGPSPHAPCLSLSPTWVSFRSVWGNTWLFRNNFWWLSSVSHSQPGDFSGSWSRGKKRRKEGHFPGLH